jgi:hypothetical protein
MHSVGNRSAPKVERLIGSIRRECVDHVLGLDGAHPRILRSYARYSDAPVSCR